MTRPRLGLTLGDPAGIGPEVVVRALADPEVRDTCAPVVIGAEWACKRAEDVLGCRVAADTIDTDAGASAQSPLGEAGADGGACAMAALETAARMAEAGELDGIVTAPVSKAMIQSAGFTSFIGHTEYFGKRVGVPEPTMFFWSPDLCVSLVTVHCALADVPRRLTSQRIATTIDRTVEVVAALGEAVPRIGICGLNPHAGEAGLFGTEDAERILPVVREKQADGLLVEGPLPADTAFVRARRGDFNAIVAMYHDQGLAPFKLIAFDSGVNVTLGLPYVRTSVDHGTAFDIAGKGTADASSMKAAIRLAARLVHATHSVR